MDTTRQFLAAASAICGAVNLPPIVPPTPTQNSGGEKPNSPKSKTGKQIGGKKSGTSTKKPR